MNNEKRAFIFLLLGFVVPIITTVLFTTLSCRHQIALKKKISFTTWFTCPIVASSFSLLLLSFCFDGRRVFTRAYWPISDQDLVRFFVVFASLAVVCVFPALGVVVYYRRRSRKGER